MRNNNAGCLTVFVSSFSRIMLLMAWIARPALMDATFSSFILPCLGFMFLPFTTLMYVYLAQGVGTTIQGLDWLWLLLAALMDVASLGASGYSNRDRIPAGYPGSYAEKELAGPPPVAPAAPVQSVAPQPPAPAAPAQPAETKPPASAAPAQPEEPQPPAD